MAHVKGLLAFAFIALNTVWWSAGIYLVGMIRVVLRWDAAYAWLSVVMSWMANAWVAGNKWMLRALRITQIDEHRTATAQLSPRTWHVVISNHQTWADIFVLQTTFVGRVPPLKFFVKRVLIWVPGVGFAMWLLDFPYVRRFPRAQLDANPTLREIDRQATLKACERFKRRPTTVLNFVEGTRFTLTKHQMYGSTYRHLLPPKTGGLGYVLSALGPRVTQATDVTIYYPGGVPTFWEFLCGKCARIRVEIRDLPIPVEIQVGGPELAASGRERLRTWVEEIWQTKDARLDELTRHDGAQRDGEARPG